MSDNISKLEIGGDSEYQDMIGSHHLMVEIMKALAKLDMDNQVIVGFEATIQYKQNPEKTTTEEVEYLGIDDEGGTVLVDKKLLNRMNLIREERLKLDLIDMFEQLTYTDAMDRSNFKKLIDDTMGMLFKIYRKDNILQALGLQKDKMLNGDTITMDEFNKLLPKVGLQYFIYINEDGYNVGSLHN